jgi:hypothetical protein
MKLFKILLFILICYSVFADDPIVVSFSGAFFENNRSPNVTESYVNSVLTPIPNNYAGEIYWYDNSNQTIYWFGGGTNGSFVWIPLGYTPPARVFSYVTPDLNNISQLSTTRDVDVRYSLSITTGLTLIVNTSSGTAYLEIADDSGFTTNVKILAKQTLSPSGVIAFSITEGKTLTGIIPAGKYVRIRTNVDSGSASFMAESSEEIQL